MDTGTVGSSEQPQPAKLPALPRDAWVVTPKPSPPELAAGFRDERAYRDPFLVPVLEKLDQASLKQLSAIIGGWPIPADG